MGTIYRRMPPVQCRAFLLVAVLLAAGALSSVHHAAAQAPGCLTELSSNQGAQLSAQVLDRDGAGGLKVVAGPATRLEARSGQVLRVSVRPTEGPDRPGGAGCPVKVEVGELDGVSKLLTEQGFIFDGGTAYGEFRPDEERLLEFEFRPFEEWSSPTENVELENLVVVLPQALEFLAALPPPAAPAPGTICADVIFPDAQPAVGITLNLRVPPDAPPESRTTGSNGRACWEGLNDVALYGELALDSAVSAALGQSKNRYVSPQASYRLFVVKRPR